MGFFFFFRSFNLLSKPVTCCASLLFTGITRFDLLGDFGRFNWLGNFYIVLSYNLLFAVVTTLCLVRKFTSAVREELLKALGKFIYLFFKCPVCFWIFCGLWSYLCSNNNFTALFQPDLESTKIWSETLIPQTYTVALEGDGVYFSQTARARVTK